MNFTVTTDNTFCLKWPPSFLKNQTHQGTVHIFFHFPNLSVSIDVYVDIKGGNSISLVDLRTKMILDQLQIHFVKDHLLQLFTRPILSNSKSIYKLLKSERTIKVPFSVNLIIRV